MPFTVSGQSREYLLKAGYVEKFIHFIEWPEEQNNNDSIFRIAVIGDDNFRRALEVIFKKVKVKNRTVKVVHIASVPEISNSMILLVSGSNNIKLDEILNYTIGKPILTISENNGYGRKGIIINLIVVDNYIRYEINRKTLDKSKLKISSLLLKSAIIIDANE